MHWRPVKLHVCSDVASVCVCVCVCVCLCMCVCSGLRGPFLLCGSTMNDQSPQQPPSLSRTSTPSLTLICSWSVESHGCIIHKLKIILTGNDGHHRTFTITTEWFTNSTVRTFSKEKNPSKSINNAGMKYSKKPWETMWYRDFTMVLRCFNPLKLLQIWLKICFRINKNKTKNPNTGITAHLKKKCLIVLNVHLGL